VSIVKDLTSTMTNCVCC